MSDIFREVDEELRREQAKRLWEQYGWLMITVAVLIVVAVGGWRAYQWNAARQAAAAGAAFEAAAVLSEEGKGAEAEAAFAKVAAEGTPAYRALARLRAANEVAKRDPKAAVALYDAVAADGSAGQVLQDVATLRAGLILVDEAPYADLAKRLEPLTGADRGFRHSARLALGMTAWRTGDAAATKRWADMILADAETPASARGRAEMLLALGTPAPAKS